MRRWVVWGDSLDLPGSTAKISCLILRAIVEGKVYTGQGTQHARTLLGQLLQLEARSCKGTSRTVESGEHAQ